ERSAGLAAQSHLENIVSNACLDGFAQLTLDFKEAIGRTKSLNTLVGTLVIIVFDPAADPFARRVETLELGAGEELLPNGGPEAFDLAQSHRVLRTGFEMGHTLFFKFGFEAGSAPPTGVLAAVIGEHLFGRFELCHRLAVNFDDRFGGRTAEDGPRAER